MTFKCSNCGKELSTDFKLEEQSEVQCPSCNSKYQISIEEVEEKESSLTASGLIDAVENGMPVEKALQLYLNI